MGTRADFYVGRGKGAEWLGSIAWDGYPDGDVADIFGATDEAGWRAAVAGMLAKREDGTVPDEGWPWPWNDSRTTDYAYTFDEGKVWFSCFGHPWHDAKEKAKDRDFDPCVGRKVPFPDMSARKAVTLGKRSGVIVMGAATGALKEKP